MSIISQDTHLFLFFFLFFLLPPSVAPASAACSSPFSSSFVSSAFSKTCLAIRVANPFAAGDSSTFAISGSTRFYSSAAYFSFNICSSYSIRIRSASAASTLKRSSYSNLTLSNSANSAATRASSSSFYLSNSAASAAKRASSSFLR